MVERRERVKEGVGLVLVAVRLGHVIDDRFGVFNHVTVAVDDGVTLVGDGYLLPVYRSLLIHQGKGDLSRPPSVVSGYESWVSGSTRNPERFLRRGAEPFFVELVVGAVFFELQQRFVDRFAQPALVRKYDAIVFLAKDRADGMNFPFAFV